MKYVIHNLAPGLSDYDALLLVALHVEPGRCDCCRSAEGRAQYHRLRPYELEGATYYVRAEKLNSRSDTFYITARNL